MRFVHAADLHLDSPLQGLDRYPGAPVERLRGATREAFRRLVDLVMAERADFLLIAGDVYDGDWKDYRTGQFFVAGLLRLREAGIPVLLVSGNHDAASQITKNLTLPDNVRAFDPGKPSTITMDSLGVAVHGQGFLRREVTSDLTADYPEPVEGLFNIGLLHTSLDGRPGHAPYAPCTVAGLVARGYQYWALGHVHRREVVSEAPYVVFPGNIQGRHARETGPKGCTVVTVLGDRVATEHRDLDVVRWVHCEVDAGDAAGEGEVIDRVRAAVQRQVTANPAILLAARITVGGRCAAHRMLADDPEHAVAEIRMAAADAGAGDLWVEKVLLRTRAALDLDELASRDDAMGGLLRAAGELARDHVALGALHEEFEDLAQKLPRELKLGDDPLDLHDPETYRHALEYARQLLADRLLREGGTP